MPIWQVTNNLTCPKESTVYIAGCTGLLIWFSILCGGRQLIWQPILYAAISFCTGGRRGHRALWSIYPWGYDNLYICCSMHALLQHGKTYVCRYWLKGVCTKSPCWRSHHWVNPISQDPVMSLCGGSIVMKHLLAWENEHQHIQQLRVHENELMLCLSCIHRGAYQLLGRWRSVACNDNSRSLFCICMN